MIIYKTINTINGKIYVGQDSKNDPNYLGSGVILNKAISKYGKENFKKEILEECSTKEELNEREIYWIKKLKAQDREIGYNIADGGTGGATVKGEKHPGYGKELKKEVKEKISNTLKRKGIKPPVHNWKLEGGSPTKGMKFSDESKEKMAKRKRKAVIQLDKNNNIIREYKSIIETNNYGYNRKYVSYCCRGIWAEYSGYIWKFKKDINNK